MNEIMGEDFQVGTLFKKSKPDSKLPGLLKNATNYSLVQAHNTTESKALVLGAFIGFKLPKVGGFQVFEKLAEGFRLFLVPHMIC